MQQQLAQRGPCTCKGTDSRGLENPGKYRFSPRRTLFRHQRKGGGEVADMSCGKKNRSSTIVDVAFSPYSSFSRNGFKRMFVFGFQKREISRRTTAAESPIPLSGPGVDDFSNNVPTNPYPSNSFPVQCSTMRFYCSLTRRLSVPEGGGTHRIFIKTWPTTEFREQTLFVFRSGTKTKSNGKTKPSKPTRLKMLT